MTAKEAAADIMNEGDPSSVAEVKPRVVFEVRQWRKNGESREIETFETEAEADDERINILESNMLNRDNVPFHSFDRQEVIDFINEANS
jgi:hypothetical protein